MAQSLIDKVREALVEAGGEGIGDNQEFGTVPEVGQKSLHDDENAGRRMGSHRVAAAARLS